MQVQGKAVYYTVIDICSPEFLEIFEESLIVLFPNVSNVYWSDGDSFVAERVIRKVDFSCFAFEVILCCEKIVWIWRCYHR